jgi:catechol 2,3-dioxygenase-like lactoylglutathione lyase family enzyme
MGARFGHAGIVVRDLDSQIRFYSQVFGLEVETRITRQGSFIENVTGMERSTVEIVILGNEDRRSSIELLNYVSHPDHSPVRAANAMNCNHVMFVVDDIEDAWRDVIDAGGKPFSDPQSPPDRSKSLFYFRDPEGTILELVQYHDL